MFLCEFGDGIAESYKRTDGNDASANGLQIEESSADSRAGADDVVDDRHASALYSGVQGSRKTVLDRKHALTSCTGKALGVDEIAAEFERDQQSDERALNQRTAGYLDIVLPEFCCKLSGKWL